MIPPSASPDEREPWHTRDATAVFDRLGSRAEGLTSGQAAQRRLQYGINRLRPAHRQSALFRLLAQFHNILIYVLLLSALLTAALHHWIDTGVIIGVVFINALIGFIQEGRAEQALAAIQHILPRYAIARRDDLWQEVNAEEVVPGDVIALQAGDKVPADMRLFYCKNLQIDEAVLTGESSPTAKSIDVCGRDAIIGDRHCMAYSGTLVTSGQGHGMAVSIGERTEIGRINELVKKVRPTTTPLLKQIDRFGRQLTLAILGLGLITFTFGILARDYSIVETLLAVVGLCVAAIPEGLPAIMTIALAIGVRRMARHNAIIRRLPGVETLGAVTVICTDKTGTLTRNEMTVQIMVTLDGVFEVTGSGYNTAGRVFLGSESIAADAYPGFQEAARAAVLCNDAALRIDGGHSVVHGDPTEVALLILGIKSNLDPRHESESLPRSDIIPFEPEYRYMATLHHHHKGHGLIYTKGAPERILQMCVHQRMQTVDAPLEPEYWQTQMEQMAGRGLRLLAIAVKQVDAAQRTLEFDDMKSGFCLLAIVGMMDPPREEAVDAVRECHNAGIHVKMITGDHAKTAAAVGARIGIGDGKTALTGSEIDRLDSRQLAASIECVDIFARTSPEHKLRLVETLQASGNVVAMTGDGVNDAPALRRADIGIAMGRKGTEVAAEASEMVLVDDNFASIVRAVGEGRTVYDNLRKSLLFILPTNGGEALTIMLAILAGTALPITAVQILWVNMVTEVTLALALVFEPAEPLAMRRPPRDPAEPILSGFLMWRILFVSLIVVTGVFGLFMWHYGQGASIEYARTVAVNTLVMFEIFYLFNTRYLHASALHLRALRGNRYIWIAVSILVVLQLLFTYAPLLQRLFGTVPLAGGDWPGIIATASSVFFLVELEKVLQTMIAGGAKRSGIARQAGI
jgi:magnesium-transporting ATPase (P-type)